MSKELLLWIMARIEPLVPYMLVVILATIIMMTVLLQLGRNVWVSQRRFRWLGLFLGLSGEDCMRLACSWIKLILQIVFLLAFRKLSISHYLLFLLSGLFYAISFREILRIPGRLVWLVLEGISLFTCNAVCGYIQDIDPGIGYLIVYVLMAFFCILFGVYVFLMELNDISAGRGTNFEYEWNTGAGNGEGE